MTREQKIAFVNASSTILLCPNTGEMIEAQLGDDKVCCPCGRPNPKAPTEAVSGFVHHQVHLLQRVSAERYVDAKAKKA